MTPAITQTTTAANTAAEDRLPLGAILLLGAFVFAMLRQGAYHQWQHQTFAVLVGLSAVTLLGSGQGRRALASGAVIITPLMLSTGISFVFASDRSDARSTVLQVAMVGVGLAVGISITRGSLDVAINALTLIALIVAATAIWGVATHTTPWGRITDGVWRGSSSLTYANAAASMAGPVALLTFTRAALTNSRLHAMATVFLAIGFASTQSRGGALAVAVVGLGAIVYLGISRFASAALPIALGVAVGLPRLLMKAPNDTAPSTVFVILMIAAGIVITTFAWPMRDRVPRPGAVLVAIVLLAGTGAVVTGAADSITERFTLRSGTTSQGEEAEVLFGDRAKEWSTAWDRFSESPVVGNGPGVVDLRWVEDGRQFRALFVHNEYLEFAVTHGALGIAALLAAAFLALRQSRMNETTWPVALAVLAFLLHSTVDFLWHIPALPVFFAALAGLVASRSV